MIRGQATVIPHLAVQQIKHLQIDLSILRAEHDTAIQQLLAQGPAIRTLERKLKASQTTTDRLRSNATNPYHLDVEGLRFVRSLVHPDRHQTADKETLDAFTQATSIMNRIMGAR